MQWIAKNPGGRLAKCVPETLVMVLDDIDYFDEAMADCYEVSSIPYILYIQCSIMYSII